MRTYGALMSMPKVFAMIVALALLLAPALTRAGEAMAAAPNHHGQMMDSGHCKAPALKADDGNAGHHGKTDHQGKADGKSCCVSMCMAVAVAPTAPITEFDHLITPATFAVTTIHLPFEGELATPPPRLI